MYVKRAYGVDKIPLWQEKVSNWIVKKYRLLSKCFGLFLPYTYQVCSLQGHITVIIKIDTTEYT